jgi:hypothetical protein
MKVILNQEAFIYVLAHSSRLSLSGPLGMVYELLRDYFVPNGLDLFFKVCGHIVQSHVPTLVLHLFYEF